MAWEVVFDEEAQTIVTTFSGVGKREDLMKAYQKRKQISQETGSTRLLIDTTECITDIFITVDMYTLVEKLYAEDLK
ncbi:MAG: hypothetical protein V2J07_06305, partial [Anaerolineae bacterium]|nr:hypothetical protein [Anaerolineae bacterium]